MGLAYLITGDYQVDVPRGEEVIRAKRNRRIITVSGVVLLAVVTTVAL